MEKGHQYKSFEREGLKINCARAALVFCLHKKTKLTVCLNWNGSAFENRTLFFFLLSFRKS